MEKRIAAIVPVFEEVQLLPRLLAALRESGVDELVVADGGSDDGSAELAERYADAVVTSAPGRAVQMNAGAAAAGSECLWFVHADSGIEAVQVRALRGALRAGARWGRFDVRLTGGRFIYRAIGAAMNLRSRYTGIATGDQGIFVTRCLFEAVGGFPSQPLMEDIALCSRLRRHAAPACLRPAVLTSSRRWERDGAWRTIFLMWRLRWAYWRGADPERLHARYYGARR